MNPFSPLKFNVDAVVIDNGDFPTHHIPLRWMFDAPYIVCCDGAANHYVAMGKKPDAIVGDGDSISEKNRIIFASIIHRMEEQETNDQTKAIHFLKKKGMNNIVIVGGTGRREDHTLGNISLLIDYAREGMKVLMATNHGVFIPCRDTTCLETFVGQAISIFNFGATDMEADNLLYPIYDFTSWWQGTLNQATAQNIIIRATGEYLVHMNYSTKTKPKQ